MRSYISKKINGLRATIFKQKKKSLLNFLLVFLSLALIYTIADKKISAERSISGSATAEVLQRYADQITKKCSKEKFTPPCYDEEIPKLMDFISMENAFKVTWLIQAKDDKYVYCHVLGHKLSYRETAKNPAGWKDVLTRCPTTKCNNGCLHGSLLERFNADYLTSEQVEELIPDLKDVCEPRGTWNPQRVEISMCYHALGHLAMYVTKADIPKSISICGRIGEKLDGRSYTKTCVEGVFMQIFQPLEPEDYALVKGLTPEKEELTSFCSKYSRYKYAFQACHRESWPLFRDEQETPAGLMKFCQFADDDESLRTCESSVLSHITTDFVLAQKNPEKMRKYCLGLPSPRDSQCFGEVAMRLIQLDPVLSDQAISFCKMADEAKIGNECFRDLLFYSTFSFHLGTPEFMDYCRKLPEPWSTKCLKVER